MSTRAALSLAAVAVLALGLVYFRREQPAPSTPVPTPEPAAARAPIEPPTHSVDRVDAPTTTQELPAPERRQPPTVIAKIGDIEIPLKVQPGPGPFSAKELAAIEGIDDGRSSGFFAPLAAAARAGNGEAARLLQAELDRCRSYPKSRAEFDARLEQMRKGYAQTGGIAAPGEQPQDLDFREKDLERRYRRCEGVTDDMYQTSLDVLRESVEGRDNPTSALRFAYAEALRKTDPDAARAQYEILWQQGDVLALGWIPDLAHQIAWVAASIAYRHAPPEAMTRLEASTSPSEFNEASKEAAQILKNPNCCRF